MNASTRLSLVSLLVLSLVACGKSDAPGEAEAEAEAETQAAATQPAPAPAPAPAPQAGPAPTAQAALGVADIERWQRGMAAEKKAVQDAAAKLAAARDDNTRMEALHAATDMGSADAGAKAAGLDRDGYQRIRTTLSSAVAQLSPLEVEMDVSQMPPQMVEQFKQSRAAGVEHLARELPADVMAALKARAGELRQQDKELAAERLKAANAAR